jgi:hypothetical protein
VYEKAAKKLAEYGIPLAKVDVSAEVEIGKKYEINGNSQFYSYKRIKIKISKTT